MLDICKQHSKVILYGSCRNYKNSNPEWSWSKEMTLCSFKLHKCTCIVNISKYVVDKCQSVNKDFDYTVKTDWSKSQKKLVTLMHLKGTIKIGHFGQ